MARGGDGYAVFRNAKHLQSDDDAPLIASEVIRYLKALGTIRTGIEGRLVVR
jgi:hypothetical protein